MKVLKGNMGWHADSTYMPVQAKGAVFTAHIVPPSGGETGWADMRAAYDCLDADMREKLEGLSAYHSLHYSQKIKAAIAATAFMIKTRPLDHSLKRIPKPVKSRY